MFENSVQCAESPLQWLHFQISSLLWGVYIPEIYAQPWLMYVGNKHGPSVISGSKILEIPSWLTSDWDSWKNKLPFLSINLKPTQNQHTLVVWDKSLDTCGFLGNGISNFLKDVYQGSWLLEDPSPYGYSIFMLVSFHRLILGELFKSSFNRVLCGAFTFATAPCVTPLDVYSDGKPGPLRDVFSLSKLLISKMPSPCHTVIVILLSWSKLCCWDVWMDKR